jgi:hypothetical protein
VSLEIVTRYQNKKIKEKTKKNMRNKNESISGEYNGPLNKTSDQEYV